MILEIDPQSNEPLYLQMKRQIILGLAHGQLAFGEQLPSVRALADEIGVNMMTVSKAYTALKEDGYLVTDRRTGTKIAESIPEANDFVDHFTQELSLLLADWFNHGKSAEECLTLAANILETFRKEHQ
ncbi:GntR family transcriptional regulator [Enterococcus timonensis]|uniref:GntR family transcriptional regulator n=1 Tax=Enterococcus timonensis TaxID=1852364 RepID=UPI0008DAB084|nr:GntR family transcriptional regulator [Enterococcus timonensis]